MTTGRLTALFALALASLLADGAICGRTGFQIASAHAQESAASGIFHGVGVVTAIDATTGALTLDHEDIKGLMPAMVMMYRVEPRRLSDGLRKGDKIAFDIDAGRYTITGVKILQPAK
jgi:Cu/Ag efflux protein CusF